MDASGHLRTVSALLDLEEFEVVDLQQDRRTKQNVIGVIPKAAASIRSMLGSASPGAKPHPRRARRVARWAWWRISRRARRTCVV